MHPTPYPDVNRLLDDLLSGIRAILGDKLVGLYLYGSLVWGDFDHDTSDIDLLAALTSDLNEQEAAALKAMHDDIARTYMAWDDRIEVQYLSLHGLKTFRTRSTPMAVISPGEPFHIIKADKEWLLNWYFVQDYGITLFGPSPRTFIDPISKDEFIRAVVHHAHQWPKWIPKTRHSRPYQSYAILTMCRSLYTYKHGQQVSKKQAAHWAQEELPQWATLIQSALEWRLAARLPDRVDHEATYPEARRFVHYISDLIPPE
jgi:predicted nucleotidyltransferase